MWSARRQTLAGMGLIVATAAFEHGLGETLQGGVAPAGLVIESWPSSEFFRTLSGEPAMTIVPNLLISGLLTMVLSITFAVWMTRFVDRRGSALVIAALSVSLLLVGGGFGPPVLGLILAAAALKVNVPLTWWRTAVPDGIRRVLSAAWPILFGGLIVAWLTMFPGLPALGYFFGLENDALVYTVLVLAVLLLPLTIFSSFARDIEREAWRTAEDAARLEWE